MINQEVKTFNDRYYNTHQTSILSNTVTESDIYDNYSYTSCVNWEIEKTSETPSKKLEFYIDNPETGLKKIDFNIITNNNGINDINDDNRNHSNNDLTDDVYNNIDHNNVNWKQTTHNSLYILANDNLKINSDLEDLDWNSIDSHKSELIITYDNKVGNKTLHPRASYALYIIPNEQGTGYLIYSLSTNQKVVTKDFQSVPVPEDTVETICKLDQYENKSQVVDVDTILSIVHDDQSINYDNNDHTPFSNKD